MLIIAAAVAQSHQPKIRTYPGQPIDESLPASKITPPVSRDVTAKPFKGWFDPIEAQAYNRNLKFPPTAKPQVTYYTNAIFPDSTVVVSDKDGNYSLDLHSMGSILDPQSSYLYAMPDGKPSLGSQGAVVTKNDEYKLDSILVDAWYVKKKTAVTDTLYVWISWQKPYENDVFVKNKSTDMVGPPQSSWRDSILSIRIDTLADSQGTGNVIKPKALPENKVLIKYALTNNDTAKIVSGGRAAKRIPIRVSPDPANALTIPAGYVTSCNIAYIPAAGSYAAGDCIYQYANPKKKQNANGLALKMWAADSVHHNYLVDPSSKSSAGLLFPLFDRYPLLKGEKTYFIRGYLNYAPAIMYHISGISTVGIKELSENENFTLAQNVPNPFTSETTISYQLKTPAKNTSLVIYNVTGAKVFEQSHFNLIAGKYSVNVNASGLSSGIYFYSLTVDGSQVTRKMIITE